MPITEKQLERRKMSIGSSDMAPILGLSPWANAHDVFLGKTAALEPRKETMVMNRGHRFETGVLDFARDELGPLISNQLRTLPEFHLHANLDAQVMATKEPVEAKTIGIDYYVPKTEWGEFGTDEIPEHIIIQCHVHLICLRQSDIVTCYVPVYIGGRGFGMFKVIQDAELSDIIKRAAKGFWENHVIPGIPPVDAPPSIDVVKRVRREPNKSVEIDPIRAQVHLEAKERLKAAEKASKEATAAMLADFGDAECGVATGIGAFTFLEVTTNRLDAKSLKGAHPDIAAQFMKQSSHRRLSFKQEKE